MLADYDMHAINVQTRTSQNAPKTKKKKQKTQPKTKKRKKPRTSRHPCIGTKKAAFVIF